MNTGDEDRTLENIQIRKIEKTESETLPYRIEICPSLGRYLVATKDLQKGQIIFQETPLAIAPQKNSSIICPGCFSDPKVECDRCGWALCSFECPNLDRHQKVECILLQNARNGKTTGRDWKILQDSLMVLRCLCLKKDPELWAQLMEMESNWSQWSKSPLYKSAFELAYHLRKDYHLTESVDEILQLQAILDINAYEIKMPEVNIQGCFKLASLAEHSCLPNAMKTISATTLLLTLRAVRDIRKGEHIATTYCDILWPTIRRQRYMQWSKFFICECERCCEPSELKSFIGALDCPHCLDGSLLPHWSTITDNLDDDEGELSWANTDKDYRCHKCNAKFACKGIESFIVNAENQLHEADQIGGKGKIEEGILALEDWLEQWTGSPKGAENARIITKRPMTSKEMRVGCSSSSLVFLHPQHSLALDACHTLFLLYSKDTSSLSLLMRKDALGTLLLQATKNLFTGISMFRGTVMYELGLTKAAILARHMDSPEEQNDLSTLAQEILCLLTESLDHLRFESPDQPEGKLFSLGLRQLEELQEFLAPLLSKINSLHQ